MERLLRGEAINNFASFGFVLARVVGDTRIHCPSKQSSRTRHSFNTCEKIYLAKLTIKLGLTIRSGTKNQAETAICIKEVKLKLLRTLIEVCRRFFSLCRGQKTKEAETATVDKVIIVCALS